jgi:hypothetical protein
MLKHRMFALFPIVAISSLCYGAAYDDVYEAELHAAELDILECPGSGTFTPYQLRTMAEADIKMRKDMRDMVAANEELRRRDAYVADLGGDAFKVALPVEEDEMVDAYEARRADFCAVHGCVGERSRVLDADEVAHLEMLRDIVQLS